MYNLPVYRFIRDNGGWCNWEFILLEDYPCRNKKQLNIRERFWFEKLGAKLNSYYPERESREETTKEYREKNKEKIREKNKKNKEKIKEKVECGCGSVVRKDGLSQHKRSKKHQNWEKTQVE